MATAAPRPELFLSIFVAWVAALIWFQPRLLQLLTIADGPLSWLAMAFFIAFLELAWLYGFYNIGVIIFAEIYRRFLQKKPITISPIPSAPPPAVALLYTTCNDFVKTSAESCVQQDYPNFTVYILDDSNDPAYRRRIDSFAKAYPERVRVVRRSDRRGFKAGNLNHALAGATAQEPFFALADSDEVLPPHFLTQLVPRLQADPNCGFVQANHRSNPNSSSTLAVAMGIGIDIHWRWYQPLRNRFGFVMLLGHGAVLRRSCWEAVGGFPDIVSEDLAYAVRLREKGWRGLFADDVVCYEDFPDSVRAFRIRFMKWTRGTCEFLAREAGRLALSKNISLVEKLDILFPTLNLPLALFYFLFIIDANLVLPLLFGSSHPVTLTAGGYELVLPMIRLDPAFTVIYSVDFFLITLLTLFAPILCFIIELGSKPFYLFRFLCQSTVVYAALGPISSLGVFSYILTRKATFLVTGDRSDLWSDQQEIRGLSIVHQAGTHVRRLFTESHPSHFVVQTIEVSCGVLFGVSAILLGNIAFLGLAIGFILHPLMHRMSWNHKVLKRLTYLPFILIITGISLGGLGLMGIQTVFFGYGFHF